MLVEHWDSDANQASSAEGTSEITDHDRTADNRRTVLEYLTQGAAEHLSPDFIDHRGPEGAVVSYDQVHHVIADGNFVFALSEGQLDAVAYGLYDLFRLQDAKLVERWDSRRVVPATTASGLGIF
jgi:predicted SnoaL-like aldol condensation-catalyzing enzyme